MKLALITVGVTDDRELAPAIERYLKRLSHYAPLDIEELKSPKHFSKLDKEELKREEGKLVLGRVTSQDMVILLDERGMSLGSVAFSGQLQQWINAGGRRMVFIIGGAFGFSDEMYNRADHRLALSPMTLTHQMVRLFFVEQLYRAFTILRNEKYHH